MNGSWRSSYSAPIAPASPSYFGHLQKRSNIAAPRKSGGLGASVHRTLTRRDCMPKERSIRQLARECREDQGVGLANSSALMSPASKPLNDAKEACQIDLLVVTMPQKPSSLKCASARGAHASMCELAKIGLHGALQGGRPQCVMAPECAFLRSWAVLGEGRAGFRREIGSHLARNWGSRKRGSHGTVPPPTFGSLQPQLLQTRTKTKTFF